MKIWVTRNSGLSIQCAGLERLFVWFRKPRFIKEYIQEKDRELPFGDDLTELEAPLYKRLGWEVSLTNTCWIEHSTSFGKLFGYDGEIPEFVWGKLKEHFHDKPFDEWDKMDYQGITKVQDFLLELDLDIKLSVEENIKLN